MSNLKDFTAEEVFEVFRDARNDHDQSLINKCRAELKGRRSKAARKWLGRLLDDAVNRRKKSSDSARNQLTYESEKASATTEVDKATCTVVVNHGIDKFRQQLIERARSSITMSTYSYYLLEKNPIVIALNEASKKPNMHINLVVDMRTNGRRCPNSNEASPQTDEMYFLRGNPL